MAEKAYKLRPLKSKDFFKTLKFLEKIGFEKFQESFTNLSGDVSVGINLIITVISTICANEETIYEFLSEFCDLTKEKIADLPLEDFVELNSDFFRQRVFWLYSGIYRYYGARKIRKKSKRKFKQIYRVVVSKIQRPFELFRDWF